MDQQTRAVIFDNELERGFFDGKRWYIQTARFDYLGDLVAVTPLSFVFENVSVVFDTGPYKEFLSGKGGDLQKLDGSTKSVFDRASAIIHRVD